jgi:hypothetical protein
MLPVVAVVVMVMYLILVVVVVESQLVMFCKIGLVLDMVLVVQ